MGGTDPWVIASVPGHLTLVKTTTPPNGTYWGGDTICFTIVVANDGTGIATNVQLNDNLPGEFPWSIVPPVAGCALVFPPPSLPPSATASLLYCSYGNLAPGAAETVTVCSPTQPTVSGVVDPTCVLAPGMRNIATAVDDEGDVAIYAADLTCLGSNVPGCPDCNPRLDAATGCTILQSDAFKVDITGPAGQIQSDICIGPSGKLAMSGSNFVTDDVRLDVGATCSGCSSARVHGAVVTDDLTAEIDACDAASRDLRPTPAGTLTCTQTLPTLTGTQTITGGSGLNVICVTDVDVGGNQIVTLNGPVDQSAEFIFVVSGEFEINNGKILVSPNVKKSHVLYNVIGTGRKIAFKGGGGGVDCCKAEIDGSLIALEREIALSPGRINGQVCGDRKQTYAGGSSVRCPRL